MNYFLVKTEPSDYSIDDLKRQNVTTWDGVHNFAAINFIKMMNPGDMVFIYHSGKEKAIVGAAEVVTSPKLNTEDPRTSWVVDLSYVSKFDGPTLAEFKSNSGFRNFALVKQSRLSVMPVSQDIAKWIKQFVQTLSSDAHSSLQA